LIKWIKGDEWRNDFEAVVRQADFRTFLLRTPLRRYNPDFSGPFRVAVKISSPLPGVGRLRTALSIGWPSASFSSSGPRVLKRTRGAQG